MILCVTPNPAIDRTLVVPGFKPGAVFRPTSQLAAPGGKGVNVARAVRVLGGAALCAGFVGGGTGRQLAELAEREGLGAVWTWIGAETRTCIIVADPDAEATVINENGPTVTAEEWSRLEADILRESAQASAVCFSGSLPQGQPPDVFAGLLQTLRGAGRAVWVDTSGAALAAALAVPGLHIKVNGDEAGAALGLAVEDINSAALAAAQLRARGAEIAALTLGGQGAVLAHETGCWHTQPPPVKVMSSVGSGDSFLAGLVQGFAAGLPPDEALRWGAAAGTANAMSVVGGRFSRQDFESVLAGTTVNRL
ncbi:MAG: hexose kinase [Chloroflexi bacterium]|nr:hexose kinase [Chloroflexota bacterium]